MSVERAEVEIAKPSGAPPPIVFENQVVWVLWLTYGAFYFCRTNLSAAVPGMEMPVSEGGLGLTGEQVGWVMLALKFAYGIGQLLNGQLAERFAPRRLLAVGMLCSAAHNGVRGEKWRC